MCFLNEADWYAEVCEATAHAAAKPVACDECHRLIAVGQTVHHTYLQQHEECQRCADGECECICLYEPDDGCCSCEEPCHGETFDYDCCDDCRRFLAAVKAAEIEAGCRASEAQPTLCDMVVSISEGGRHEAVKYFAKAVVLFPDLVASGYLAWLHNEMFGTAEYESAAAHGGEG